MNDNVPKGRAVGEQFNGYPTSSLYKNEPPESFFLGTFQIFLTSLNFYCNFKITTTFDNEVLELLVLCTDSLVLGERELNEGLPKEQSVGRSIPCWNL